MIDLNSKSDVTRLFSAINAARDACRPFCRNRTDAIKEYVGSQYSDKGSEYPVIVNLMNQGAEAYTIALAANCPRVRVVTEFPQLLPFAHRFQVGLNNFIQEVHLEETLSQIVLDAFFSIGIAKVYQKESGWVQLEEDFWVDPGRPYVGRISLDDFFLDMSSGDLRRCKFMGDDYRVSWQKVQNLARLGIYDSEVVDQLSPSNRYGDPYTSERTQEITSGSMFDQDEYEQRLWLRDVWLSDLNQVATFARDRETPPLLVRPSDYEGGPYHVLGLADVPDNVMPSAPAQNLRHLHDLYNDLMAKMDAQARRHKVILAYSPAAAEDVERIHQTEDGGSVKVRHPNDMKTVEFGGIVPTNALFATGVMQLFDRMGGNLEASLGLGPQAETLGQEQLIHGQISRKEGRLIGRVNRFTSEVLQHVGHLMWHDMALQIPAQEEVVPGSGIMVDNSWDEEAREGDFWQYNFRIEPYSMAYQPPAQKAQKLQMVMPMVLQVLQARAAGAPIDVEYTIDFMAEALDLPELRHVYSELFAASPQQPSGETPQVAAPAPPREYIRRNVSMGGTPQARTEKLQDAMARIASVGTRGTGQSQGTTA